MPDNFTDWRFPVGGIALDRAFCKQQPRPLPQGQWDTTGQVAVVPGIGPAPTPTDVYGRTCAVGQNVRGFEATSQRRRGGSRPGLTKYIPQLVGGVDWVVQGLNRIIWTGGTPVQQSQAGRVVTLVAVSQGNVFAAQAGDTAWTAASNTTGDNPPLIYTGQLFSASNSQKLWFADGSNWVYYDPLTNTVNRWSASAGSLPVDSENNTPRLVCNWRDRIVLSGLFLSPAGIYMSAIGDPTNWDFAPLNYTPTQAFATTLGPTGSVGEQVTALIPVNDDVLLVGTSHQLYLFSGDPQAGGQISLLTNAVGIAFGQAHCQDPYGTVYFFSNKTGIYSMTPGQPPVRISQPIEQLVNAINTGTNSIRMAWNDRFQGVHVFVTPLEGPGSTTHFFFEARTGAWWTDVYANTNHNPLAVCEFDGNTESDRTVLTGGWDGYVRKIDPTAPDDDGTPIASRVVIGPIMGKTFEEMRLDELVADLAEGSGDVTYDVLTGTTAEAALSATPVHSGTLSASRNRAKVIRRSGHAIYLDLTAVVAWAMERIRMRVTDTGLVRARRK